MWSPSGNPDPGQVGIKNNKGSGLRILGLGRAGGEPEGTMGRQATKYEA